MKRELRRWEIVGFAVTGLVGTLLHFVYGWSDGSQPHRGGIFRCE